MKKYDKKNPCLLHIKERKLLNKPGSTKRTYHISLDLADTGFHFTPGDSVGIFPDNPYTDVEVILSLIPNDPVICPRTNQPMDLKTYLLKRANLDRVTTPLLKIVAPHLLDSPEEKLTTQQTQTVTSLLAKYPAISAQELASSLAPLIPRFYSIASSLNKYQNELHLLVAEIYYQKGSYKKSGVTSHFLCNNVDETTPIPTFLLPNTKFSLPDPTVPIIMIGPGTGVAPYRAFLHEREEHSTRNWLFFGERNESTDFIYEDYLKKLESDNKLILTTAFSRDSPTKIYVQHKMLENQKALWQWLQEGATIYVCGDKKNMAKDVHQALVNIAENHHENGPEYARNLRLSGRYLTDVY